MLKLGLVAAIVAVLLFWGNQQLPYVGGAYRLTNQDHGDVMVVPALLVNIASSDPGNVTRLEVQAKTYPDAMLDQLFTRTDALDWARIHQPDVVVLQEHSCWFDMVDDNLYAAQAADWSYDTKGTADWSRAAQAFGAKPLLFEVWGDGDNSDHFTDRKSYAFGRTPDQEAELAARATQRLSRQLGLPVAAVGDAFARARRTPGAPDLYGPDHHHASMAGAYLAALVFYRHFTGRSGAAAAYRPWGLSADDAALLSRAADG